MRYSKIEIGIGRTAAYATMFVIAPGAVISFFRVLFALHYSASLPKFNDAVHQAVELRLIEFVGFVFAGFVSYFVCMVTGFNEFVDEKAKRLEAGR